MNDVRTALGGFTFAVLTALAATTVPGSNARADAPQPIAYRITVAGNNIHTTVDNARFVLTGDRVRLVDLAGRDREEFTPTITVDGAARPLGRSISADGRTLTLSPQLSPVTAAHPVASPLEEQRALTELSSSLISGPLLGSLVGAVVGAVIGVAVGAATCLVVGPVCVAAMPAAAGAFGAAGAVAGLVAGGGIALADGLWKYLTTVQSPPGQSPYAGKGGETTPDGTVVPDGNLRLPTGSANGLRGAAPSGSAH